MISGVLLLNGVLDEFSERLILFLYILLPCRLPEFPFYRFDILPNKLQPIIHLIGPGCNKGLQLLMGFLSPFVFVLDPQPAQVVLEIGQEHILGWDDVPVPGSFFLHEDVVDEVEEFLLVVARAETLFVLALGLQDPALQDSGLGQFLGGGSRGGWKGFMGGYEVRGCFEVDGLGDLAQIPTGKPTQHEPILQLPRHNLLQIDHQLDHILLIRLQYLIGLKHRKQFRLHIVLRLNVW